MVRNSSGKTGLVPSSYIDSETGKTGLVPSSYIDSETDEIDVNNTYV